MHIRIKCPTKAGSLFFNYKQFFSIVLQGVADSESRFIFINIGAYGKQSDCGKFSASTVYHFLEGSESTLQKPASFEGSRTEVPVVILGDEAYPLKMSLMKPFARKDLSGEERVFNYKLSRARRCVQCAFGSLTAKRRLLNDVIETNINKAEIIGRCICLLRNIIACVEGITRDPSVFKKLHKFTDPVMPKHTSTVHHSIGPQKEQQV
jgi:hypothetical protein